MKQRENVLVVALKERIILVNAKITSELADRFETGLNLLAARGTDSVRCYVSSSGGSAGAVLRMMQLVTRAPFPVDFVGVNWVASAGFLLMQCGRRAYAAGATSFTFHRLHLNYDFDDETNYGESVGWEDCVKSMWSYSVYDTIVLQWFLRRGDPRSVLFLFKKEATISAAEAKKVGLITGCLPPAQVRADKAAIQRVLGARNGSRK